MTRRRPILLLEVLIAAFLLALVAVPLLRPSVGMLIAEKREIEKLKKGEKLQQAHAVLLEALYQQKILWEEIVDAQWHSYQEFYFKFEDEIHSPKGDKEPPRYYIMWLTVAVEKGGFERRYPVLIEKKIPEAEIEA